MMLYLLLSLGLVVMSAEQVSISSDRLISEEASDFEISHALRDAGDLADVVRPINAYFVGVPFNIEGLKSDAAVKGWKIVSASEPDKAGQVYLWLERYQPVTSESLATLRNDALQIEAVYNVEYDGWDTSVETKHQ